ncbi:MAG: aminotransferase class I/II-fold pyridoxal phosphate-dependent enzyme [Anaerolineae bacterium]|nr:aminotransferase class I/II-fold pyridoxal phosphate-dependent enzyme [Anaerolineae bacterium]
MRRTDDSIAWRIKEMADRVKYLKEHDWYYYLMSSDALRGSKVVVNGREMLMFASYSYLDLIHHPRINAAAKAAIDAYSSGTHGVRLLAGSTGLHDELEKTIARFKKTDAAVTYSSGFVTNMAAISALTGRHDIVFSDRLNHASIVDGCQLSYAKFVRFRHNDMADLERKLAAADAKAGKLVVTDAVFSMDGDIIDLPGIRALCEQYGAWLMVDEAHSLGVLGETGHGIEEHFGMEGAIDIKMGTLSKTIPSVGGYIAGDAELITFLKHASRAFIFSAALPPAALAAAKAAFEVIESEPERVKKAQHNMHYFLAKLHESGFDTLDSETCIVPIICGSEENAWNMARLSQQEDIFVLPVVAPAVPEGLSRLRANVTAAHSVEEIDYTVNVFTRAAKTVGIL